MTVATLDLAQIEKNPYRDLEAHPFRAGQVEMLQASMESTGFWEGLLVRPHPEKKGFYQLAFGHARWMAAKTMDPPVARADFIVHDIDDDAMIRAMADENITQFGRDEYATYREAVTAAVERIMGEIVANPADASIYIEPSPNGQDIVAADAILGGDAPGEGTIVRYFKRTFSRPAIRMALKEYRESGKLAAWHAKHNPKAMKPPEKPKVNSKALGQFESVVHVQAFTKACEDVGVPPERQEALAATVLKALKDPEPTIETTNAKARKRNVDYQKTDRPPHERLTARNIRQVVADTVGKQSTSTAERRRLEAQAQAISVESALTEMSIGLKRAAKAGSELLRVVRVIGDLDIDMTTTATLRLEDCRTALKNLAALMATVREESKINLNIGRLK